MCHIFDVGPATATEVHILLALIRLGTWLGLLGIHSTAAMEEVGRNTKE